MAGGQTLKLQRTLQDRATPLSAWPAARFFRRRALLPCASDPSAADAPGPPEHRAAPRGEWRYRGSASRQQFGIPTVSGRLPADPGGEREVGHFPWFALARFSDRVTGISAVSLDGGHRAAVAPGVPGTS